MAVNLKKSRKTEPSTIELKPKPGTANPRDQVVNLGKLKEVKTDVRKFPQLDKGLQGLYGADVLAGHLKLYEGYVKRLNALDAKLKSTAVDSPDWSELQRRFCWEWNGVHFHELYFESLTHGGSEATAEDHLQLAKLAEPLYGGFDRWVINLKQLAEHVTGQGWAVACISEDEPKRLMNGWVADHDHALLAKMSVLFPIDLWEHAWYGLVEGTETGPDQKKAYVDALFKNLDWSAIALKAMDLSESD